MHPFPPASDLQFLIGLEVEQIGLGPWTTNIGFSEGGGITIEGPFEHVDAQKRSHMHQAGDEQDVGPVYLRELLQQRIAAVQRDEARLTLVFDNGAVLRLWSEDIPYESGQIYRPGDDRKPIVF